METLEFLRTVLPTRGFYFVAVQIPGQKYGWKHHACESIEELTAKTRAFDEQGETVYYALASYSKRDVERTKDGKTYPVQRVQENVQAIRSFWLDLDVGEGAAKYPTQADAVKALGAFAFECGLPKPLIVSSGYGIHVYWPLLDDVLPGQWKTTATNLKFLAHGLKMLTDPSRTADTTSVLRPPGTHNRKNKNINGVLTASAVPVLVLGNATPVNYKEFDSIIARALKAHEIVPKYETATVVNKKINEGATATREFPPASAHLIADRCNQIKIMRESKGNIPEPQWYAALQLLDKTIEGETIVHEWGKGHPKYSKEKTIAKVAQIKSFGPTLCSTFEFKYPDGCLNCPYKGKIITPMQLGTVLKEAPAPVVKMETEVGEEDVEIPLPPLPFKRGSEDSEGLYVELEPGVPVRFYPYDLYPAALEYDESDQFETTRIHHRLPLEGWKSFTIRSSVVHAAKDFNMAMADKSIKYPFDGKYKDTMRSYLSSYLERLQEKTRIKVQYTSLGWKEENTKFLLGDRMYLANGTSHHAGISHKSKPFIQGFGTKGNLEEWKKLTSWFDRPGCEHHAFTLMLAFGAPLTHIAGLDGTLFNMTGTTSTGKSSLGRMAMSVYGDYNKMRSSTDSTINARIAKIGAFGSLPMYIDELSNITPEELSKLAYSIAGGMGREKLRSDSTAAEVAYWKTFVLSSSNHNLHNKLTLMKNSPEPETMRIFEYEFPKVQDWYHFAEKELHRTLDENYGHAGEKYIAHIVQMDKAVIRNMIEKTKDDLAKLCGSEGSERFWLFGVACTLVGGIIAKQQGLIDFNPGRVIPWIVQTVGAMRGGMKSNFSDPVSLLSRFLDEFQGERLVMKIVNMGHIKSMVAEDKMTPYQSLSQRYELEDGLLYIKAHVIKTWLIKHGEDYAAVVKDLRKRDILMSEDEPIVLGKGTKYATFREPCWKINMRTGEAVKLSLDTNQTSA